MQLQYNMVFKCYWMNISFVFQADSILCYNSIANKEGSGEEGGG